MLGGLSRHGADAVGERLGMSAAVEKRRDDALRIEPQKAAVVMIGDEKIPFRIERDPERLIEACGCRRPSISRETEVFRRLRLW
jgi:hypothetical protein